MVAGSFIVPPYTAGKVLDETTKDRREAANLGILKTALQDSVNRTARQTTAATTAASERNNMRTNLLEIPGGNPKHNVEMLRRALVKRNYSLAQTAAAQENALAKASEQGESPDLAEGPATRKQRFEAPSLSGLSTTEKAALATKKEAKTRQEVIQQQTRPGPGGTELPAGFKKKKTTITDKVTGSVPTARDITQGVRGQRVGRGQARFQPPSAPATPTAAATPEEGQKLALQQLAASQQFRASGANPKNMKYLGDEPAGKGKIRHKWVDITTKQPFSLTVRSGQ
jgi:hypothetical protein